MTVRTRFAPSPTGYLHIGGVRTALFAWLFARHHGGRFVLRIEDTDRERSTPEAIAVIVEGLAWLGLEPDEGPYFQTDRLAHYHAIADRMLSEGSAYRCYCSRAELEAMRAAQQARGETPRYDGRCRNRREPAPGLEPVIRFRTPRDGTMVVTDLIHGPVEFRNSELDDLVIVRSDGVPTFHFGVVVDDHDMGITHVIRGDDHLNNTPRQIHLIRALGFATPAYAHLPMILGPDGSKLSKRHGALSVLEYREEGYLPDAVLNYLVRLGWAHGDQEIFSRDEMVRLFDLDQVNASAARFDPAKLAWLNQHYIRSTSPEALAPHLAYQFEKLGIDTNDGPALTEVLAAYRERVTNLRELAASTRYLYQRDVFPDRAAMARHLTPPLREPLADLLERLRQLSTWTTPELHRVVAATATDYGLGFGKLGQPLRVAVTGATVSPPIDVTLALLGRQRTLERLSGAIGAIGS